MADLGNMSNRVTHGAAPTPLMVGNCCHPAKLLASELDRNIAYEMSRDSEKGLLYAYGIGLDRWHFGRCRWWSGLSVSSPPESSRTTAFSVTGQRCAAGTDRKPCFDSGPQLPGSLRAGRDESLIELLNTSLRHRRRLAPPRSYVGTFPPFSTQPCSGRLSLRLIFSPLPVPL